MAAGDQGIYERQKTRHAGSFASDNAVLATDSTTPLGIVQNVQIQFAQAIARIYAVNQDSKGKADVYYVGGRTNGQWTMARVIGPDSKSLGKFYQEFGNVCKPKSLSFTFSAQCDTGGVKTRYTCEKSVLNNVGISVQANDMLINENCSAIFANLTVKK